MRYLEAAAVLGNIVPVLGQAVGETVLGVTVFTRHADRTTRRYNGYGVTTLGFVQSHQVGSDYRDLFIADGAERQILDISPNEYVRSEIWASAPDQGIHLNTAAAFLQGLYPPLGDTEPEIMVDTLNNGSDVQNPLNGYQYVIVNGVSENSPDTIWIKGDDGCPTSSRATRSYRNSTEFQAVEESTREFYEGFWEILDSVWDYELQNCSYANAYDIYDIINVASIHNETSPAANVTDEDLFQLRTLASSWEWNTNYNESDPARSIQGKTLAAGVLDQMNQTVSTAGRLKFSLMAGSYDTMMAFFGLTDMPSVSPDFYGLPEYGSTIAFELFTPNTVEEFPTNTDDLRVRFSFRNGSDAGSTLNTFPLFGQDTLSWADFVTEMQAISISDAGEWCTICESTMDFCAAINGSLITDGSESHQGGGGGISNAVAGVIGAMVTLGVVLILGGIAFVVLRKRKSTPAVPAAAPVARQEKGSMSSGSGSGNAV